MINFIKLREEHLEQVLVWRTKESITKYMITDVENNMEKHRKWYEQINKSNKDRYWVISIKDTLVGVISLNNIDLYHRRTSWGYYIGEEKFQMYGAIIPLYLYNYVFEELKLHKITAEVIRDNNKVVKINKLHGCRQVGIYYDHVYKNGKYYDLVLMELLKEDWLKKEKNLKYKASFEE